MWDQTLNNSSIQSSTKFVAERMNLNLPNIIHSMMFFNNVKSMFWADVVLCADYVKTRQCPSRALKNKTPYEMWYGRIPLVRHLRVFGSRYYSLIPKEKTSKLEARSQKCIFLGPTQIPPRDIIFMMRKTRNSSFPKI